MSKLTKKALSTAACAVMLSAGLRGASATEPGSFGNYLPGGTMGAPIAAAPPPGLYFNNTFTYFPLLSGNGNTSCGPGCKSRYTGAADSISFTWGSGMTFLGATYFPSIQLSGDEVTATTLPYVPGGGLGLSPIYGNIIDHEIRNLYANPINLSWKLGNVPLFFNAGLGFVAPVGTTYAGSTVPDYWTVRNHAAISYLGEGWNLTANLTYDINTASQGNTGIYEIIARNPATSAASSAFLSGPANPGDGYTSGNYLFVDWTATKKFGKWEVGPVGYFKFQTTDDSPGGINPATRAAWTCNQLTAAGLPSCGKDIKVGVGLLIGYDFGPVDMKLIYSDGVYTRDALDANTGSTLWLKTSFRLWAPDDGPVKKPLYTKN